MGGWSPRGGSPTFFDGFRLFLYVPLGALRSPVTSTPKKKTSLRTLFQKLMQYDALGNNLKCKNQHPRHPPPPPPPHPPPPHHHAGLNHQHSTSANLGQSSFRANILAWVMSFLAARPLCKWQMSSSRLGLCSAFYGKYLPANPMKQNQYTYRYIMYYILSTYISIFKWKLICTKYHICL